MPRAPEPIKPQPKQTAFQKYDINCDGKIVDFTIWRLVRLIKTATIQKKRIGALALLTDYKAGKILVAWKDGQPVFSVIQKDK